MNTSRLSLTSCLSLAVLLAACDGGGTQAGGDNGAAFAAAADAVAAKLQSGEIPPAGDPAVKALEAQSAKALNTLGTPALPVHGFDSFEKLCGKTAGVVGAYVNAGTATAGARQTEVMNRNGVQLIDNLFSTLLFSARCTAAHLSFIEKEVGDDTKDKAAALQQVRNGAMGQAGGLIQMAGASDLDGERRGRILDLLAADAGNFAIVLSPAQRQQLAEAAEATRDSLPNERKAEVDKIKSGFTGAPCGSLCKM